MKCSNCGTEVTSDMMFCANCGNDLRIDESTSEILNSKIECPNCDTLNDISMAFCIECGTQLNSKTVPPSSVVNQQPNYQTPPPGGYIPPTVSKSGTSLPILIGVVVTVLVLIVVLVLLLNPFNMLGKDVDGSIPVDDNQVVIEDNLRDVQGTELPNSENEATDSTEVLDKTEDSQAITEESEYQWILIDSEYVDNYVYADGTESCVMEDYWIDNGYLYGYREYVCADDTNFNPAKINGETTDVSFDWTFIDSYYLPGEELIIDAYGGIVEDNTNYFDFGTDVLVFEYGYENDVTSYFNGVSKNGYTSGLSINEASGPSGDVIPNHNDSGTFSMTFPPIDDTNEIFVIEVSGYKSSVKLYFQPRLISDWDDNGVIQYDSQDGHWELYDTDISETEYNCYDYNYILENGNIEGTVSYVCDNLSPVPSLEVDVDWTQFDSIYNPGDEVVIDVFADTVNEINYYDITYEYFDYAYASSMTYYSYFDGVSVSRAIGGLELSRENMGDTSPVTDSAELSFRVPGIYDEYDILYIYVHCSGYDMTFYYKPVIY